MLLLARLEQETRAYHRDADRPWLSLLAPDLSRGRYAAQLARAYGFEAPFDAALVNTPLLTSVVEPRLRGRLLSRDLFALDYGPLDCLPRAAIAPFASVADACGWLYALERSARLYPMIAGHILLRQPPLETALGYLQDDDAQQRWRELGAALDEIAHTPRIANQILMAAHTAFRTLTAWYAPIADAMRAGA